MTQETLDKIATIVLDLELAVYELQRGTPDAVWFVQAMRRRVVQLSKLLEGVGAQ